MGKISEYDKINKLSASDTFILEGADGTKGITTNNLVYAALDASIPVEMRRNIFRGKNLGGVYTDAQKSEVRAGTFKDLFLGDYWEIGGFIWRIVDINYWLNTGERSFCRTPHLVIMPDTYLYKAQMNDTNTTAGGYVGSKMYTENLEEAKNIVNSSFGSENILNHDEKIVNAVTDGYSTASAFYDSTVELPNEIMIFGSYINTPNGNGSVCPEINTVSKAQLSLFRQCPKFTILKFDKVACWLRDVIDATRFCGISWSGSQAFMLPSLYYGVRPVFGLIG